MNELSYLILIIPLIYAIMMMAFSLGWLRLPAYQNEYFKSVSIIIAVRNEEENIPHLLECLHLQSYPTHLLQVIVVDDHSTDHTFQLIEEDPMVQNIRLPSNLRGKKAAIQKGIEEAKGEILLFTDADCFLPFDWVRNMVMPFANEGVHLVAGPVQIKGEGLWAKIQEVEFYSLMAMTAGGIGIGLPMMCNAANMAIRKQSWYEALRVGLGKEYASGDDVFMMLSIAKIFGRRSITFLKSTRAVIITKALRTLPEFFRQRIRWASKTKGYISPFPQFVALIVFLTNLLFLISMLGAIFYFPAFGLAFEIFIIKSLADIVVMIPALLFFHSFWKIPAIILFQPFYPFYIVSVALMSQVVRTVWKGRRI